MSGTTIISGAIAERTNFYFYIIFSVFNTFVFCLPARWLWAETGFLKTMGVVDLAGSCGVNLVGGAGAFVGERLGKSELTRRSIARFDRVDNALIQL